MGERFERALTAIFTKRPVPGRVKTRLHPVLGPELASELALAMLDDIVLRCAESRRFATELWAADEADLEWFAGRYPALAGHRAQRGGGLGERMAEFFERVLAEDSRRSAVIVGSDAPLLERATIEAAHAALARGKELVLVPDDGGGYALVGLARPERRLFTEVAMSTGDMLGRTLELASARGFDTELLEPCFDVDTPDDFERLCRELVHRLAQSEPVPTTVAGTLESWGLLARA